MPNSGEISPKAARLNPGPGTYQYKNLTIGHQTLAFTLKSRPRNTQEPQEIARKQDVPGPGYYRTLTIDPRGEYPLSTTPNSRAGTWSPHKGNRFKSERSSNMPEPGTYNPSDKCSVNDSYLLSTFKNPGFHKMVPIPAKQFTGSNRHCKTTHNTNAFTALGTPGPG
jgi:hypothetical protein